MRFSDAFEKLQKATVSFVMSVCLSVCKSVHSSAWNNSAVTGGIFLKFYILVFFETVKKMQVSLKSDKNYGYFT